MSEGNQTRPPKFGPCLMDLECRPISGRPKVKFPHKGHLSSLVFGVLDKSLESPFDPLI